MPESRSHKRAKGFSEKIEIPISKGRRLDAKRGRYGIEVSTLVILKELEKQVDNPA